MIALAFDSLERMARSQNSFQFGQRFSYLAFVMSYVSAYMVAYGMLSICNAINVDSDHLFRGSNLPARQHGHGGTVSSSDAFVWTKSIMNKIQQSAPVISCISSYF